MVETFVTLWPDMPHYQRFSRHPLVKGIRLNTAMIDDTGLEDLLRSAKNIPRSAPIYFDIKGRQLRIVEVIPCGGDHLELEINHPIEVETPVPVLFKAGADGALLIEVKNGTRLIFEGGPKFNLNIGESLCIRSKTLKVLGGLFTPQQLFYLDAALKAGIDRYMLSYATSQEEIEELKAVVGDVEIVAKIENLAGLDYAKNKFQAIPNKLHLLTARGDLFVELDMPHDILKASKDLLKADPNAIVGSRILLSVTADPVPSCSDVNELAWLLDIGYRRFMFCDGLCLDGIALDRALKILHTVAKSYLET